MRTRGVFVAALAALAVTVSLPAATPSASGPSAPTGVTGLALSGTVQVAWQPVSGANGYTVYRGTSPTTISTLLTPSAGITSTTYSDTSAVDGTTYYYAVRTIVGGVASPSSLTVQAKPVSRACSTGNGVVLENCYP